MQVLIRVVFLSIVGCAGIAEIYSQSIKEKILQLQDQYRFSYVFAHWYETPRFKNLFQFTDRVDSAHLYFQYKLEENNPFYEFSSIRSTTPLGDSLLAVEGDAYLADYRHYDSLSALTSLYRVTDGQLKARLSKESIHFRTDDSGKRYTWIQEPRRLLLKPDDFDRLIVTNCNFWVGSEEEKRKVAAAKRLGYSMPRTIGGVVFTSVLVAAGVGIELLRRQLNFY